MRPKLAVFSLASDFGCQVQMTNMEDVLLDVLGLFEIAYWQLLSSGHVPDEYDVAVVEGAVTSDEHVELLRDIRRKAKIVVAIGACAITGGIPAMVTGGRTPVSVTSVIDVDYVVPGCPIDPPEFVRVVSRALQGLSDATPAEPLCSTCKTKENVCFWESGEVCLGVLTRNGCGARCVTLGRACSGCRGLAPEANLDSAREVFTKHGADLAAVVSRLELYNAVEEVTF
ncbi:MAG: NADH:ubiquinone oxidoreductase [Coriobacteriia bacterium]